MTFPMVCLEKELIKKTEVLPYQMLQRQKIGIFLPIFLI